MEDFVKIPEEKKIRVIIDTDAACEADDPFAIAQALMSPKLVVKGILAEHFNEPGSVQKSYDEIVTVLKAMKKDVPVFMGQEQPIDKNPDEKESEAVRFIISEAMREGNEPCDKKPLYILCQGAITNVAVALRSCPAIKEKIVIIWIGTHGACIPAAGVGTQDAEVGTQSVPFREYNSGNDIAAANLVLESGAEVWLIPASVYSTITVGLAELKVKVAPYGEIGRHLYENMVVYNLSERAGWTQGESWSLGDSPAVAAAINPGCGKFVLCKAPHINSDTSSSFKEDNPVIRVYTSMDSRYILEDFFAKLHLNFSRD